MKNFETHFIDYIENSKNKLLHKIESIISFIDLHDVISIKKTAGEKHNISFQTEPYNS